MRRATSIAVLTIVLLFAAMTASADIITSSLTGRATAGEQPLSGVRVTVTATTSPYARTTMTNAEGRYFIDALPPGRYDVVFELAGHQSLIRPVVIELGRVARTDAVLQPSEDEETVTSTAMTQSVVDTTAITSHFDRGELDRLPRWAGPGAGGGGSTLLDGARMNAGLLAYEVVEEVTTFIAAAPAFVGTSSATALRTRSGMEKWSATLRDTWYESEYTSGHLYEANAGGRIVSDRLWFFGSGWKGDHVRANSTEGFFLKLTAQTPGGHDLTLTRFDADRTTFTSFTATTTQLRYDGVLGADVAIEALLSRQNQQTNFIMGDENEGTLRLSWNLGSHILSGGVSHQVRDDTFTEISGRSDYDETTFIVGDRWLWKNVVLDTSVRHTDDHTLPRVALTYDLRGNGRQAIAASYGEHAAPTSDYTLEVSALGFITAVGTGGSARIDAIRRHSVGTTTDQVRVESRYRLFDRFEFGAVYSREDTEERAVNVGRIWTGGRFALGSHELGLTIAESHAYGDWGTDVALRYLVPVSRIALTLATDAFDLFGDRRSVRVWARVRL